MALLLSACGSAHSYESRTGGSAGQGRTSEATSSTSTSTASSESPSSLSSTPSRPASVAGRSACELLPTSLASETLPPDTSLEPFETGTDKCSYAVQGTAQGQTVSLALEPPGYLARVAAAMEKTAGELGQSMTRPAGLGANAFELAGPVPGGHERRDLVAFDMGGGTVALEVDGAPKLVDSGRVETVARAIRSASPSNSGSAQASGLPNLGASINAWLAHHTQNDFTLTGGGKGGTSGPEISPGVPTFENIAVNDDHVYAYHMLLADHTAQAAAISEVRGQLPNDATLFPAHAGKSCEWFMAQSTSLGEELASTRISDPHGTITVLLESANSDEVYRTGDVYDASITSQRLSSEEPCETPYP